ncbi:MAG: flavin reductase [Candidatus Puniceispirillum sp.]|nr:flavin reductase [Candidatus Puniceispirillum sp.]
MEETMQVPQDTTFRQTLARFTTGVCVVATQDNETKAYLGMTINAFSSVSLDPPLILFCLKKSAKRTPAFEGASSFSISVLAKSQEDLSRHFARDAAIDWSAFGDTPLETHAPFLKGAIAHIACEPHAVHAAGDHLIFVARVTHVHFDDTSAPLVYFGSQYAHLDNLPLASSRKAS